MKTNLTLIETMNFLKSKWLVFFSFLFVFAISFSLLYKIYFSQPYLTVIGVVRMADGIGRQSVELIDSLKDQLSIGFLKTAAPCYKDVPKEVKKIVKNHYRPLGKVIVFEDCIWTPEKEHYKLLRNKKNDSQIRFAYTMFESTQIPAEWVTILNEYFDAAIVPDPFHVKVYENSGVDIPIFVLPLGLNLKPFLSQSREKREDNKIVFGNFGACLDRKNQKLLVEAFIEAFGNSDKVFLKINSRYTHETTALEIEKIIQDKNVSNICFSSKSLSNEEYLKEFQSIDCLVSISKGEGFSIQPREAMALGIPVIVSDNTAQKTICRSGLIRKVKSEVLEPSMNTWGTILKAPIQYGYQYNCEKKDVVEALVEMAEHYDEYADRSLKLKDWVKKYDYEELKPYYLSLVKPKNVYLSTTNKILKDSLYTNSSKLYQKYKKLLKGKGTFEDYQRSPVKLK